MNLAVGYGDGVVLAVLAAALGESVPAMLARSAWPARAPRAALVLWIAVAVTAGLAMVGSLLSLGLAPLGRHLLPALLTDPRLITNGAVSLPIISWLLVAGGAAVLCWYLVVVIGCALSVAVNRRAHRGVLDVVGTWEHELGTVVLEDERMLAYHLPGLRDSRVVISRGCVDLTRGQELAAILAHERAHARGLHHVLVQPFVAWERTFPFLTGAAMARAHVALLTEMLADDAAVRSVGAPATVSALHRVSSGHADSSACTMGWQPEPDMLARVRRLLDPRPPAGPWLTAAVYAAACALVLIPTVMLATW